MHSYLQGVFRWLIMGKPFWRGDISNLGGIYLYTKLEKIREVQVHIQVVRTIIAVPIILIANITLVLRLVASMVVRLAFWVVLSQEE